MSDFIMALKDRAIFLVWVVGLVLAASLLWMLSSSFRAEVLMRVTNRTLVLVDDERHLTAPIHPASDAGLMRSPGLLRSPVGYWYRLSESDSLFFVFTIMREGILVPCGAEISVQGRVVDIVPLGNHARQVMGRVPQSMIQIYIRRIESTAANIVIAANASAAAAVVSGGGK